MGSTLTSTQPKDTYKSLLKTSDTTELSATAKYVSDGNGNDSALALSTTKVGIGTDAPTAPLDTVANSSANVLTLRTRSGSDDYSFVQFKNNAGTEVVSEFFGHRTGASTGRLGFSTNNGATMLEHLSITSDGYVRLTTNSGGIQFNGDTSANNALSDYEQGTFTPSLGGDATYLAQSGTYTKIGRVVTFKALVYVNVIGTGSTTTISGLPFTIAADGGAVCSAPSYSGLATSVSSANGNVVSTSIAIQSNVGNAATNQTLNAIFQNSTYLEIAGTYQV
jgi:hypothetical protein